ncbi:MAG: hypothetical protein ILO36_02770 [Abditibacteriota bacterium]|nr:hypothetical protein [Abditibacteriota bacterium]
MKIIANRGYSSNFPENTMLAFGKAAETGCDMIMLDVRSTKDNVPVALKDASLDRTTNTFGDIKSKTFQELTAFRAGYSEIFGQQFAEEGIPSLEEVFGTFRKKRLMLNIYSSFDTPLVREAMRKTKYSEKNAILTFNNPEDISTARGAGFRGEIFFRSPLEDYFRAQDRSVFIANAKKNGANGFVVSYSDMFGVLDQSKRGVFMVQCAKNRLPVYVIGSSSTLDIQAAMEYQLRGLIGKKGYTGKFAGVITPDPGRAMLIAGRLKAGVIK